MDKKTFVKILDENDILWNDMVTIYIINPHKKLWEFWKPNKITFYGALGFTLKDDVVSLCSEDPNDEFNTVNLYFNFEEIIGIKKCEKNPEEPKSIRLRKKIIGGFYYDEDI